jgi:hypothetical protein
MIVLIIQTPLVQVGHQKFTPSRQDSEAKSSLKTTTMLAGEMLLDVHDIAQF